MVPPMSAWDPTRHAAPASSCLLILRAPVQPPNAVRATPTPKFHGRGSGQHMVRLMYISDIIRDHFLGIETPFVRPLC